MLNQLLGYHLRRATLAVYGDLARALEGTGLRQNQFGLLAILDETPGIRQGEAGRILGIQRANMVSLVSELVAGGLIDRRSANDDRRALSLQLTDRGSQAYRDCLTRIQASEAALLSDFSPAQRQQLFAMLRLLERKMPQRS